MRGSDETAHRRLRTHTGREPSWRYRVAAGQAIRSRPPERDLIESIKSSDDCGALAVHYEDAIAGVIAEVDEAPFGIVAEAFGFEPSSRNLPVLAFLLDDALDQLDAIAADLAGWEGVISAEAVDRDQALEEFRVRFADQPDLVAIVEEDPTALSASVRLAVEPESRADIVERLASYPGVRQVENPDFDQFGNAVAIQAVGDTGRTAIVVAIQVTGEDLGCTLEDLALLADLSGIETTGWVTELILDSARRGLG